MRVRTFLLPLVLLAASTVAATAQKPKIDFDASWDFSSATTFAISQNGQPAANEMVQRRIEEMVEAELEIKGLRATSPSEADLTVIIGAYSRQRTKQSNVNIGVGVSRRTSRGSISVGGTTGGRTKTVQEGTLVIDLRDTTTNDLVWQSIVDGTLKGNAEQRQKKVNQAIHRSFAEFPPR